MKANYIGSSLLLIKALILFYLFSVGSSTYCLFNPLCYCSNLDKSLLDVTCLKLPLTSLPYLPFDSIFRLNIIAFDKLRTLNDKALVNLSLSALVIKKTKLSYINSLAFQPIWSSLTSLDLSYNQLNQLPISSLINFTSLTWLNLQGNQISNVSSFFFFSNNSNIWLTLNSLLLGDNLLTSIPELGFIKLKNLQFLELDNNLISKIDGRPFPLSLESLSLAHNLLEKIPVEAFWNLHRLKWLQLRGNLIKQLPGYWPFSVYKLDILDLSHNVIFSLQHSFFNKILMKQHKTDAEIDSKTIFIKDFLLDFNFIEQLEDDIFSNVTVKKLSLSNNHLSKIALNTFSGPILNNLYFINLNYNLLENFPKALKPLTKLSNLLLRNNRIKNIEADVFKSCSNALQVLDLSGNWLTEIPSLALNVTTSLLKLNLQKNSINKIDNLSLGHWSKSLRFLSISKNKILQITQQSFKHCLNLKELHLAYNNLKNQKDLYFLKPLQPKLSALELSFSLKNLECLNTLEQMKKLEILEIDHNKIKMIPDQFLKNLSSLVHLDLESNKIEELEPNWLNVNKKNKLRNILLSYNTLKSIKSYTFYNLQVVNIVLLANQLEMIENFGFTNLGSLKTLVLASNQLKIINDKAFYNCSRLVNLFLQENQIETLSFNLFQNIKPVQFALNSNFENFQDSSLFINVSKNKIQTLTYQKINPKSLIENFNFNLSHNFTSINVKTIDLSHNLIDSIDGEIFQIICAHLTSLFISFNRLKKLDWLKNCPKLVEVYLDHNQIENLNSFNGHYFKQIIILNLSFNYISNLNRHDIFQSMTKLKYLDLSFNLIKNIDPIIWENLTLESLNLSNNQLVNDEKMFQNCFSLSSSLKTLDISGNLLKSVPSNLKLCSQLVELNLENNQISILNDKTFSNFKNLQELSLSNNYLKQINSKTFIDLICLHTLKLNNVSLNVLPFLPLHHLANLELASNKLTDVSSSSLIKANNLKKLDLSKNRLSSVPKNIWRHVPNLAELNLASNSIDTIDSISFVDLKRLTNLDIRGLNLKHIDLRMLNPLKHLISIKTSTYPKIRSFRLHDLLAKTISLRNVLIDIQETVLSHQIQWAFGSKLKELIITGSKLRRIIPDAFLGLYRRPTLVLRIIGTNITTLPIGLIRYITDVRYITLDLRNNKLNQLKWNVINFPTNENLLSLKNFSENNMQVSGELMVNNNPLICTCNLVWLGSWLRKWLRETKKIHRFNYEAIFKSYSNVKLTKCKLYPTQLKISQNTNDIPLINLYASDLNCNSFTLRLAAIPWFIIFIFSKNLFFKLF